MKHLICLQEEASRPFHATCDQSALDERPRRKRRRSLSRRHASEFLGWLALTNVRGRRECRALAATHGPPATRKAGGSHHRSSRRPAFPARWFDGLYVISSGTGLLPPSSASSSHRRFDLSTGRPGPHDFAGASEPFVRAETHAAVRCAHRIPASRAVTIAIRPSSMRRDNGSKPQFPIKRKQKVFAAGPRRADPLEIASEISFSARTI